MKHSNTPPLPPRMELIPEPKPMKSRQDWAARIQDYVKAMRKIMRKNEKMPRLDMSDAIVKRRSTVLLDTLDTIRKRYGHLSGFGADNPNALEEAWLNINFIPSTTYNLQESQYHLMYAAAIWMLDRILAKDGAHWDINRWLPRDDHVLDELDGPCAWDCWLDDELIQSVVWVIYHRNDDLGFDLGDTFDGPSVFTSDLAAADGHHGNVGSRMNFEGLLRMIPEEDMRQAGEHFREVFWQWSDRYFAGLSTLNEPVPKKRQEINQVATAYNDAREELRQATAEAQNRKQKNQQTLKKAQKPAVNPLLVHPPQSASVDQAAQFIQQFGVKNGSSLDFMHLASSPLGGVIEQPAFVRMETITNRMIDLAQKFERLSDEMDELVESGSRYTYRMSREGYIRRESCEEEFGQEAAAQMTDISIADPYELCFGLLYLIEQGDDLPWLYGIGTGLISEVVESLPWGIFDYEEPEDTAWFDLEEDEEPEQLSMLPLPAPDPVHSKAIPDIYERKYLAKQEDMFAMKRNLAQIVFEETGCILPRNMHRYDFREKALKREYGVTAKEAGQLLLVMNTLGYARRHHDALNFREDSMRWWDEDERERNGQTETSSPLDAPAEKPTATIEELEAENRRLLDEIKHLRGSLYETERQTRELRKEMTAEREAARIEHRELADFRELVFRQENGQDQEDQIPEDDQRFPYAVQRDTVIFGGHDSWVKAIRPMLEGNVRFIDKDLHFDASIIRHADVIWIQANALSHKQYYRIIDAARQFHKPVRYFTYASAWKGAAQVMENDQKNQRAGA